MLSRVFVAITLFLTVPQISRGDLVAYWNFNTLVPGTTTAAPSNVGVTAYAPSSGSGSLDLVGWTSANPPLVGTGSTNGITNFAGSPLNAIGSDLAGQALSLQPFTSNVNNGASLIVQVNLSGLENPVFSWAGRDTDTGFQAIQLAYSTNGVAYNDFGTATNLTTTFALQTADFGSENALDGSSTAFFRLTFSGGTAAGGNVRIDNIQLNATAVPEPTSIALVSLVGGSGLFAAYRKRRKQQA
jgi:hypothetical protein